MRQLFFLLAVVMIIASCKKDNIKTTPLASINITNAVVGGTTAKFGSRATTISNNGYTNYALVAGANDLYIYPSADSLHPYYNEAKFNVTEGEIYSLFLTGTPGAIDAIKIKESIPYRTDSTGGIRFINLAPSSSPLTITSKKAPATNIVTDLAYKQNTNFLTFAAQASTIPDTIQVRNAAGSILTTFNFSASTQPRFANITLVIRQSGSGVAVFRVNNDR